MTAGCVHLTSQSFMCHAALVRLVVDLVIVLIICVLCMVHIGMMACRIPR